MNKIQTAASLLREVSKNTTDAAAFAVKVSKEGNRITLTADKKRRGPGCGTLDTFYHEKDVVQICGALDLSFWFSARLDRDVNGIEVPAFAVEIYHYGK